MKITFFMFLMFPIILLSEGLPPLVIPPFDASLILNQIVEMIKNWSGFNLGIASTVLIIIISFLKSDICGKWFQNANPILKRVIIGFLGLIASCVMQISGGMTVASALYGALIVSGGAVLIFEFVISIIPEEAKTKTLTFALNSVMWVLNKFKKQDPLQ